MAINASTEAGREMSFNFLTWFGSTERRIMGCGDAATVLNGKKTLRITVVESTEILKVSDCHCL